MAALGGWQGMVNPQGVAVQDRGNASNGSLPVVLFIEDKTAIIPNQGAVVEYVGAVAGFFPVGRNQVCLSTGPGSGWWPSLGVKVNDNQDILSHRQGLRVDPRSACRNRLNTPYQRRIDGLAAIGRSVRMPSRDSVVRSKITSTGQGPMIRSAAARFSTAIPAIQGVWRGLPSEFVVAMMSMSITLACRDGSPVARIRANASK